LLTLKEYYQNMTQEQKKTVLVIEDERPLLEAIKAKLISSGFEVVTARTTEEGLNFLKDGVNIDVIWLDHYLLGSETGLDLVAILKKEESKWRNIPIFVVSNTASPEKVQSYMHLGVDKYYTKSDFRLDQIIGDIKQFLSTKNTE